MLRSLMSGVSGVRGHQTSLDVVGNNIANVNTAGYKRSSITFQDLLYQNASNTMAPSDQRGGVNAKQIGLGMQVSAIEVLHTQGTTQFTGNRTDFAIEGDGYFVVKDGNSNLFTRAGNFVLDAESDLVQAGTGYRLQGYEIVRDPIDPLQFNQGSTLTDINIPTGQKMEARATTVVGYRCNLDSRAATYLPMGLTWNNFHTVATLNNQRYDVTMQEGTTANSFMTLTIGGQELALRLTGVDGSTGRPELAADPLEIDGSLYTASFDPATCTLTLTNVAPDNPDEWSLNLEDQMDYQTLTIINGTERYSYLAEFDDINTTGTEEGYRTLRLWGENYLGDMASFEFTVRMNDDGSFNIPDEALDDVTRLGGFAGGSYVTIANASGGRGIELTSTVEIVDASGIIDQVGIRPTIVQNVGIGEKAYDVTITEGNPDSGYVTLKFVDRNDPNNIGTLQLNYNGLTTTGEVMLSPVGPVVLDGDSYTASYDDTTGILKVSTWNYDLGSRIAMGPALDDLGNIPDTIDVGTPLAGKLTPDATVDGKVRTEFDSRGAGDYIFTILGQDASKPTFLEVQTFNFRQYMGVVPATTNVIVGSDSYSVTLSEGEAANEFMTLTFDGVGTPNTVTFAMDGLAQLDPSDPSSLRLKMTTSESITLDSVTYDVITYDPTTGVLTFSNTPTPPNPAQTFTCEVGKYINFQTVTDSNGKKYVVDFDEAGSSGFTMKVWQPDPIEAGYSGDPNTFTIPVTRDGNMQALSTINQRIANVHETKIDVYDSLGNNYTLEVSWEKIDNGIWRWRAWLPDSEISLSNNTGLIRFTPDGKIDTTDTGMYNARPTINVQFDEVGAMASEIRLDFSGESFQKELLDGVTQYGSEFTTKGYYQDGYTMGVLTDFAVAQDGTVNGIYSNGQNIPMYRVALALFANPAGLVKIGNTAFRDSNNSGIPQIGSPQQDGAGSIVGSSLEMSNVDLTEEFTKLITSQRGFQANARMITTSDQVLEELINIKR